MPRTGFQLLRLLLLAAASVTVCLAKFIQSPDLLARGLAFKVLPPMTEVVVKGQDATIPCQPLPTEHGVANVTWIKNAMPLNDDRRYVLSNGSLFIRAVNQSDKGMYSCVLTVGNYSVASHFMYLTFAIAKVWQIEPRNTTVRENNAVRLNCHIASLPPASITWLKDNKRLPENETRYYLPYQSVLQITSVKLQDQGTYSCVAKNPLLKKETISSGGYLSVIPHDDPSTEGAPFLLAVPSKLERKEGDRVVLECIISDNDDPVIYWSRIDGKPIPESRTKTLGQGSLEFSHVVKEDGGVYNCSAQNKNREGMLTQMITLDVMVPPHVDLSMKIRYRPALLTSIITNGQSVRITCNARGNPQPTISWFKNGVLHLQSERHQYINKNTTRISASEDLYISMTMFRDMGLYQCVARNSEGVASEGLIIKISTDTPNLPLPPVNIKVVEIHPHNLSLTWEPPPKGTVSGYIVCLYEDTLSPENMPVNGTFLQKTALKSSTIYTIYIRSFLIAKGYDDPLISEPSEYFNIKTKDEYPTEMPQVTLIPKSPTELYANWTLTQYRNSSKIVNQQIQWKTRKLHYELKEILPLNCTSYTIKDLKPNKIYAVRVLVATDAGYPQHLIQLRWYHVRMPRGDLIGVRLSTCSSSSSEVLVNWTLDTSLQNEVSIYHVYCNNTASSWQRKLETTNTSLTLTGLAPQKCYLVQVQAVFQGTNNSTESVLRTICTLPLSPLMESQQSNTNKIKIKKLKAKVLSSTSVLLTWRHTSKKMMVNFYTIKIENIKSDSSAEIDDEESNWKSGLNLESEESDLDTPESTQYLEESYVSDTPDNNLEVPVKDVRFYRVTSRKLIIPSLKPLHKYSVTVTASTTSFTGPPSVTFVTLEEGVPTPPRNVTWVAASPKDVVLTWSRPRLINGHLLSYHLAFSHDELEWRNQTIKPHMTTTEIQDLVSNTNYTLLISGVTRKGAGAASTVFIFIRATLEGEPQMTTELVVISVVSLLAVVTCVVAVLLCFKILRLRNHSPSVFQGNGTCRMVYSNGVKSSGRDHGTEPDDYKPMLASLPPATQNHHLDTKGGPGSHDDGIVANSLFDASAIQMNQGDGTSESLEPLRDCLNNHGMVDTLDDIDDANDGTRKLLQSMSTSQPVFSKNVKELARPRPLCNSTQIDHHSSPEDAEVKLEFSS